MNTEMGVVIYMYLKYFPDYIDSKYILAHGSNYVGSIVFAEIPFFGIFQPYIGRERGVARWDPAHVTPRMKLYMHTIV